MNNVGNDNYRPGLKPPEPIRRSSGWLSGNMAQLMVFLNGLILTVTAFATLSVFIDEIVKDGLNRSTHEVQQHIISGYEEAERSMRALSAIVSAPDNISITEVSKYINEDISGAEYFDQIYWIRRQKEGLWYIVPVLENKKYSDSFYIEKNFIDFVRSQTSGEAKEMYITTSLPHVKQAVENEGAIVYDRPFALIRVQGEQADPEGYLVGITHLNNIIHTGWLKERTSVYDVQVVDTVVDLPIYSYQQMQENRKSMPTSRYTSIFSGAFGDKKVDIKVDLSIDTRAAFLQKIPLLMLLFGVTLTLIGTLYVRNNQSQSQKLASMNKELAHKNFELNQEMTERERLNNVIQKSARENRAIINAVSDIIFEVSVDGTILFLNESWKKVTGFEDERSIGRNLFDLIYVQDQEEQKHNFDLLVRGQKSSYRAFTRLRSADGSFRAIEIAVSMMRQDENKEMRVVGTITDVEERRRAERALSEAEKKYRAIVENAAGGIYQVTPEGQFLSANPAFARIIGYDTPEEVLRYIEKAQDQLYVDPVARERILNEIISEDTMKSVESQVTRKDGNVIWVSENIRPVRDDDGTLLFFEGSMEDVDQRKKAEIALKEAKVESDLANRAKSEFLANMSHELRTPLNSVIGFSEIIKNEAFGELPNKEYKEYATDIYESGNNLLKVINEILDVSRIEAGERTLNETAINAQQIIRSCLNLMETKLKANGMRVENKVNDSLVSFIGEAQAVKQMLLNLMSNAIKFSPPNSFMMVDAEIDSKGRLRLSVTDTGIGLTDDELEKALSPFGQVDSEHKRSKSGTGLGLTLVKSLIELHGGELEIVSQKGIGTTATLIFPAKRVATNRPAKPNRDKEIEEKLHEAQEVIEVAETQNADSQEIDKEDI